VENEGIGRVWVIRGVDSSPSARKESDEQNLCEISTVHRTGPSSSTGDWQRRKSSSETKVSVSDLVDAS
jgi:hypothetical protein